MKPPQAHFLPPSLPSSLVPNTFLSLSVFLPFCLDSLSYHLPPTVFLPHVPFNQLPLFFCLQSFCCYCPPFSHLSVLQSPVEFHVVDNSLGLLPSSCFDSSLSASSVFSLQPSTGAGDVKPLSKCCSVLMNEAVFYCIQVFWVLIHIFIDTFSYFIHQVTTEEYNFLIIAVKNTIRCRDSGRIVHFICSFIQLCFRYNVVQR